MSKQMKAIIAGTVVIVLLAVAIAALVLLPKPDDKSTSSTESIAETITVIDEKSDTLESVQVKNELEEYTIELIGDKKWGIKALDGFPQTDSQYSSIVSSLTTLYANSIVEENPSDIAKFGLDKPKLTAKIKFSSKNEYELTVGDETPDGLKVYAMKNGDKKVYTISSSTFLSLMSKKESFLDTLIVEPLETDESGQVMAPTINRVELSRPDLIKPIVIETTEDPNEGSVTSTAMTSPIKCDINEENVSIIFFGIFGLTANSVEAVNPTSEKLAKYGLDKPSSTYSLTYNTTSSFKLITGKGIDEEGKIVSDNKNPESYYVMKDGVNIVYTVSASNITWISAQLKKMISSIAVLAPIVDLKGVDVSFGSQTSKFLYTQTVDDKGTKTVNSATLDGKTVNIDNAKKYLQLLYATSIQDINTTVPTKTPDVTISYNYLDGKVDKVELYVLEDSTTIVSINGNNAFKGRPGYVDKLKKEFENLKAGKTVSTDW